MAVRKEVLGPWTVNVSDEIVALEQRQVKRLETLLNEQWLPLVRNDYPRMYGHDYNFAVSEWKVPSLLVRFDMPPMIQNLDQVRFYEIEGNSAGYGMVSLMGLPLAPIIAEALRRLGIHEIGYGVCSSRASQTEDLTLFMMMLADQGITTHRLSFTRGSHIRADVPVWLRAGEEDKHEEGWLYRFALLLHYDGGGNKGYLRALTGAQLFAECEGLLERFPDEIDELLAAFPSGFMIKPIGGWGTHDCEAWCPYSYIKRYASTDQKVAELISRIKKCNHQRRYIVQPFQPPKIVEKKYCRIWRVFAVWTPDGYRVIGGWWSQRPNTIRIHGASDTVSGALVIG
jgi:hypothetical protein